MEKNPNPHTATTIQPRSSVMQCCHTSASPLAFVIEKKCLLIEGWLSPMKPSDNGHSSSGRIIPTQCVNRSSGPGQMVSGF